MRRKRQVLAGIGLVVGIAVLQQGLHWAGQIGPLSRQSALLKRQDLEPAAFFYTETPQALNAEKTVRRKLARTSHPFRREPRENLPAQAGAQVVTKRLDRHPVRETNQPNAAGEGISKPQQ